MLLAASTLLLLLLAAPADAAPHSRSLLQTGGKTSKNRADNELRASVATSDSILLAVRSGAGSAGILSAAKDGMALARKASSASASPSDFAPGAGSDRRRRLLLALQQYLAPQSGSAQASATGNDAFGSSSSSSSSSSSNLMQRIARKLLQGKRVGANAAITTWSVMAAAGDIQDAAFGGAQLMAVLDATQQGNKLSRQVSSRNSEPTDFDKKRTTG
uniref:Uncharacterized protein n=1 Tax=Tetradesmus obliquus TaxID=3088 RepID=A0A383VP46_TETOB|eukprot:jgi/Sobl393_1/14784/SZX66673.1